MITAAQGGDGAVSLCDQVSGPIRRDGREHRQAERGADLAGGVQQARGKPRIAGGRPRHRHDSQRWERQAATDSEQCQHWKPIAQIVGANGSARSQHEGQTDQAKPRQQHGAGAESHDQPGGDTNRQRAHPHGDRQERQADRQGAITEHALHVEGAHEEEPEHRHAADGLDDVGR